MRRLRLAGDVLLVFDLILLRVQGGDELIGRPLDGRIMIERQLQLDTAPGIKPPLNLFLNQVQHVIRLQQHRRAVFGQIDSLFQLRGAELADGLAVDLEFIISGLQDREPPKVPDPSAG